MVAEGIPEADFVTWAEDQMFAPWPEAPGAPSSITIQLRFDGAGQWEIGRASCRERVSDTV